MKIERKKIDFSVLFIMLAVVALGTVTLTACDNLFRPPQFGDAPPAANGKALVNITILDSNARTVLPDFSIAHYKLFGSLSSEETHLTTITGTTGVSVSLDAGRWNFTLEAHNSRGEPILRGMVKDKEIREIGSNSVVFTLLPLESGSGSIFITINFPLAANITGVTVECDGVDIGSGNISLSGSSAVYYLEEKAAGNYYYRFRLYSGTELRAVVSELVLVRGNVTSQKAITLVGG